MELRRDILEIIKKTKNIKNKNGLKLVKLKNNVFKNYRTENITRERRRGETVGRAESRHKIRQKI